LIRYFPNIYQDEILYSAFSRCYKYTEQTGYRTALMELYGKDSALVAVDFPSNIDSFIKQFGDISYYSSEEVIFKFTMLPLFYPFLDIEKQQYAIRNMKGNNGKGIYMKLGVMASCIKSLRNLKFCSECMKDDISKYGEAYWHRPHNVGGVYLCYKHNKILEEFCPVCNSAIGIRIKQKFTPLESKCNKGHDITVHNPTFASLMNNSMNEKHLRIAKAVEFLLNSDLTRFNIEYINENYLKLLKQKDLLTSTGRFRIKELKKQFTNYYDSEFLKQINLTIDLESSSTWLDELLHKKKQISHPIKHILIINFLVDNFKDFFFENDIELNDFGNGPWPCLNPVAEHYKKAVISKCIISNCYNTKRPIGTFICDCGFVYSRRGPDILEDDKYKIGTIKKFGYVWEDRLKYILLNEGGSLRSIARKMMADPMTIKKYSSKLGMGKSGLNDISNKVQNTNVEISERYAEPIRKYVLNQVEQPTRTEIRKLFQKEYTWLYRHDKILLQKILPPNLNRKNIYISRKVDWNDRDNKICEVVSKDIVKLLNIDKIVRITLSRIGTDTGNLSILEQHLDKLPKTEEVIEKFKETIEDFQIRRVKKVVMDLQKSQEALSEWKIYRKAGIRKNCSKKVKDEITTMINSCSKNCS
jgi:hypothetical protein